MGLLDKLLAGQGVEATPVTTGGGNPANKWGKAREVKGVPFRVHVQKLTAAEATRQGRTATTGQYVLRSLPPAKVAEEQKLDVPGVGRLDVKSVVVSELGGLRAVTIEAERVA